MTRLQEFFDHYLQDRPMPDWYKNGVPWLEMEDHLKSRPAKKLGETVTTVPRPRTAEGEEGHW
jgi:hypothetical protein